MLQFSLSLRFQHSWSSRKKRIALLLPALPAAAAEAAAAAASGDPVAQVKARVEVKWSDLMSPVNLGQKLQVNGYYHMNVEKYKHERNEGSLIT